MGRHQPTALTCVHLEILPVAGARMGSAGRAARAPDPVGDHIPVKILHHTKRAAVCKHAMGTLAASFAAAITITRIFARYTKPLHFTNKISSQRVIMNANCRISAHLKESESVGAGVATSSIPQLLTQLLGILPHCQLLMTSIYLVRGVGIFEAGARRRSSCSRLVRDARDSLRLSRTSENLYSSRPPISYRCYAISGFRDSPVSMY